MSATLENDTHPSASLPYGPLGLKPCSVSDLSTRGAGLNFASTFGIPNQFSLLIDGEKQARHCRVVWSDGRRLGVQFE